MDVTTQSITVRGVAWSHREAGFGPALVLLHGGGGTGKAFQYQLEGLSPHYRVLAPDLPGFGQSDWVPGVTAVEEMAPALLDWLTAWGLEQVALGGHSMGGRVALTTALAASHRVHHLILLDAVGVWIPDLPPRNPLDIAQAAYLPALVHDPVRYRRITPYRTLQDAQELNAGREAFKRYRAASSISPNHTLDASQAKMPTLLIWGRQDQIVPLAYGQALAAVMPQARLRIIDDTGHLPHIEAAAAVNQMIREFLGDS